MVIMIYTDTPIQSIWELTHLAWFLKKYLIGAFILKLTKTLIK